MGTSGKCDSAFGSVSCFVITGFCALARALNCMRVRKGITFDRHKSKIHANECEGYDLKDRKIENKSSLEPSPREHRPQLFIRVPPGKNAGVTPAVLNGLCRDLTPGTSLHAQGSYARMGESEAIRKNQWAVLTRQKMLLSYKQQNSLIK